MQFNSLKYKIKHSLMIEKVKETICILNIIIYILFNYSLGLFSYEDIYSVVTMGITSTNINLITMSVVLIHNLSFICLSIKLYLFYKNNLINILLRTSYDTLYRNIYIENIILIMLYSIIFYFISIIIRNPFQFDLLFLLLVILKNMYIGTMTLLLFGLFNKYAILLVTTMLITPFIVGYDSLIYIMDFSSPINGIEILIVVNFLLYLIGFIFRRYLYGNKN